MTRKCKKCLQVKLLEDFCKGKRNKYGRQNICKSCHNKKTKKWNSEHPERTKEISRKSKAKEYFLNPEKLKKRMKQQYIKNSAKRKEQRKIKYREDPSKEYTASKKWRSNHPEKRKVLARRNQTTRISTVKGRLSHRMAASMNYSLKNGSKSGSKWEDLVGYTVSDLKNHLERQFQNGMNWELLMQGKIHIDHIIPISVHNFEHPADIDFQKCWALSNLQPLWAIDNIKKSNKLDKKFQPSLKL